jgi:predicted MFS family arabinose efflux permease
VKASFALGLAGFSLIAVTYGMARFSWGLMMPAIVKDVPFSPYVAGFIAACSYAAYCLSTAGASFCVIRFGPRWPAVISTLCAAAGLFLLACSFSPLMLAGGLFIAGLSSGLASPSLAGAVARAIPEKQQTLANTVINAGTSAGIILSVLVLLIVPGGWRIACVIFGVMALLCLAPVIRYLPGRGLADGGEKNSWREIFVSRPMRRLAIISFVSGTASAAWWSFGPEILHHHSGVDSSTTGVLWMISGGAGILAVLTGPVTAVIGMRQLYRLSQFFMAAPLVLFAFSQGFSWWLFPAVALCGAGYVVLSGVLLVCATSSAKKSPASGVTVAFFMLAAGQIAGSIAFGQLYAAAGATIALTSFAALSITMMFLAPAE